MQCTIRSAATILLCLLLLGSTSTFARIIGDVDASGEVNATDLQLVINAAVGLYNNGCNADINSDLRVNAADVQLSVNVVLGRPVALPNPPTADLYAWKRAGSAPLTVRFDDFSAQGDAGIDSWHWDFGDGSTSTQQSPTHTYTTNGLYTVRLTVRAGAQASRCARQDYVCVSDLRVDSFAINNGATLTTSRLITLNNACSGNPTEWTSVEYFPREFRHPWQAYSSAPCYTIPVYETDGLWNHGLYLEVRDAQGNISPAVYDDILFDTGNVAGRFREYGESRLDSARDMQKTSDGGYILTGKTLRLVTGAAETYWDADACLVKIDSGGVEEWSGTIAAPDAQEAHSVQQTLDGGYIVAGKTLGQLAGSASFYDDVYVAKTGATGNMEWSRSFGGSRHDKGEDIKQTSDGGFIVTGSSASDEFGRGMFLLKLDQTGNVVWSRGFESALGLTSAIGHAVVQTSDGGYVLAGEAVLGDWWNVGIPLIKTDSEGNLIWWHFYQPDDLLCGVFDVQVTPDGGFALGGTSLPNWNPETASMFLGKADAEGNLLWSRHLFKPYFGYAFAQTSDGGFVVAGASALQPGAYPKWRRTAVVRTDAEGNVIWRRAQGDYLRGVAYAVQETADGNYAVAGESQYRPGTPEQETGMFWFQMDPERNYVELSE